MISFIAMKNLWKLSNIFFFEIYTIIFTNSKFSLKAPKQALMNSEYLESYYYMEIADGKCKIINIWLFLLFILDNIGKISGEVYINASVHDDLISFFQDFNAANSFVKSQIANEIESDVEDKKNGIYFLRKEDMEYRFLGIFNWFIYIAIIYLIKWQTN